MPHQSEYEDYISQNEQVFGQDPATIGSIDPDVKKRYPVGVDSDGNVSTTMRPLPWTEYDTEDGTLNNGATNQSVTFSNVTTGKEVLIINDDGANAFSFRFNSVGNPAQEIKAGETFSTTNFDITSILLSNSSGFGIAYRIRIVGI